jgi:hypothetical protein
MLLEKWNNAASALNLNSTASDIPCEVLPLQEKRVPSQTKYTISGLSWRPPVKATADSAMEI